MNFIQKVLLTGSMAAAIAANAQWTPKADFSGTSVAKATAFAIDEEVFFLGGITNFDQSTDQFWKFNMIADSWVALNNFPGQDRYGAVSFTLNGKGYICAGVATNGYLNDLWEYDPNTNAWAQKTSLPVNNGRFEAYSFVINGKGYVGGGVAPVSSGSSTNNVAFYDLWEYDPVADSWNAKASIPDHVGRNMAVGLSTNSKGYVGLGCNVAQNNNYQTFWEYDPLLDTWVSKTDFPSLATVDAAGFGFNGKLYLIGGVKLTGGISVSNQVYEYDPVADDWTALSNFDGGNIVGHVAACNGSKAFVGTGYNTNINTRTDFWEFAVALSAEHETNFTQANVVAYPNPVADKLILRVDHRITQISITDISGKVLLSILPDSNVLNHELNVEMLAAGTYIVKIYSAEGEVFTKKIMKR